MTRDAAPLAPDRATTPLGEPLVDAATVAAYLAIDTATVYRMAQRAELPGIEIAPRVLRFRPEDVREYVRTRTRRTQARNRADRLLTPRAL